MKKIQEVIDLLSPEEREQFKDLIEECLQREKEIQDNYNKSNESLGKLEKNLTNISNSFLKMQSDIQTIKTNLVIAQVTLYSQPNPIMN